MNLVPATITEPLECHFPFAVGSSLREHKTNVEMPQLAGVGGKDENGRKSTTWDKLQNCQPLGREKRILAKIWKDSVKKDLELRMLKEEDGKDPNKWRRLVHSWPTT